MNETELLSLINAWIYHNNKLREITQYLYRSTELFEKKYEHEFNQELYEFFAGKITKYGKEHNKLLSLLNEKQLGRLTFLNLTERR